MGFSQSKSSLDKEDFHEAINLPADHISCDAGVGLMVPYYTRLQ